MLRLVLGWKFLNEISAFSLTQMLGGLSSNERKPSIGYLAKTPWRATLLLTLAGRFVSMGFWLKFFDVMELQTAPFSEDIEKKLPFMIHGCSFRHVLAWIPIQGRVQLVLTTSWNSSRAVAHRIHKFENFENCKNRKWKFSGFQSTCSKWFA
jgi:hypothetical protein